MVKMIMINARTGVSIEVETGEPEPLPAPPDIEAYSAAVQAHLDAAAQSRLYTDGNSLATYTASTNEQWAAEADAFVAWRDAIWQQVYALWDAPPDPLPTPPDLIALLPEITWP